MGYTHYWERKKDLSKNWDKFLEDVKKLIGNLPKHSKSAGNEYYEEPLELAGWEQM